jgi:hypothetical protein
MPQPSSQGGSRRSLPRRRWRYRPSCQDGFLLLAVATAVLSACVVALSRFLVLWAALPCAAAPVRRRGRAADMRTPARLRNPARHRAACTPACTRTYLRGHGRAFSSFSLRRAPRRPACRAVVAFAMRDVECTREQGKKVRSLGLSVCHCCRRATYVRTSPPAA